MDHRRGIILFITASMPFTVGCSAEAASGNENDEGDTWASWDAGCDDDPSDNLKTGTTWQWQLTSEIDTTLDVDMYDIDLFDTPGDVVDTLHAAGRTVICYFSAGSFESWRDDADLFPEESLGKPMDGWEDEQWLDITSSEVRTIMSNRLDRAQLLGCDGVEPDNMDGYDNDTGFSFNGSAQLEYNRFIAEEAHARGLSVGLKNDVNQIKELEPCFDWALNEECLAYDECDRYSPFLNAGKAVFHVEYVDNTEDGPSLAAEVCGDPSIKGFSTLIKEWDLTSWGIACD